MHNFLAPAKQTFYCLRRRVMEFSIYLFVCTSLSWVALWVIFIGLFYLGAKTILYFVILLASKVSLEDAWRSFWVSTHVNELIWNSTQINENRVKLEIKKRGNNAERESHTAEIREFISFQFPCSNLTSTNNVSPRSTQKHLLVSRTQRDGHALWADFAKNEQLNDSFLSKPDREAWENVTVVFNWNCSIFAGKISLTSKAV